jgi:hypothetical protein
MVIPAVLAPNFAAAAAASDLSGRWVSTIRESAGGRLKFPDYWVQRVIEIKGSEMKGSHYYYDQKQSQPVMVKQFTGTFKVNNAPESANIFNLDVTVTSEELQKKGESSLFSSMGFDSCTKAGGKVDLFKGPCGPFQQAQNYLMTIVLVDNATMLIAGDHGKRRSTIQLTPLKKQ